MQCLGFKSKSLAYAAGMASLLSMPVIALAQEQFRIPQSQINYDNDPRVTLPLVICWHNGKKNLYIQTEASDPAIAAQQGVNYVPQLSNAIDAPNGAVDDLYLVTNSRSKEQYNILPSEPKPVGPNNQDPSYTPLWRVSKVTWKNDSQHRLLKSEEEVLDAEAKGLVIIEKTRIVVNCPIIYTDSGGLLPNAVIHLKQKDGDDDTHHDQDQ